MQQKVSQSNEAIMRQFLAFAQLPDATIEALARVLTVKPLPRGVLFEAKSEGNELFFLVSGKITFTTRNANNQPVTYTADKAGAIFGEVAFFVSEGKRTADAEVIEAGIALVLPRDKLDDFWTVYPQGLADGGAFG
jgi:CRP-like cAMP-binding protein